MSTLGETDLSGIGPASARSDSCLNSTKLTLVLTNGHLRAVSSKGVGHEIRPEYDGDDVITIGCVQMTTDAWAELKHQVDEALGL